MAIGRSQLPRASCRSYEGKRGDEQQVRQYIRRKVYESTSSITNSMTDRKYKYTHRTEVQGFSSGMSAPNSASGLPRRAPVRTKQRTIPDLGSSIPGLGYSIPDHGCSIPDLGYSQESPL